MVPALEVQLWRGEADFLIRSSAHLDLRWAGYGHMAAVDDSRRYSSGIGRTPFPSATFKAQPRKTRAAGAPATLRNPEPSPRVEEERSLKWQADGRGMAPYRIRSMIR